MVKTSKGVILSQASQIKSDYSFALIKATADNKSLVQDASSAELKVNALVEYSKDSQWDPKKLTSLGFPAGCFLIVDLRGQDIHAADLITNLALVRQYGYQAGVIDDLSTLDDIKALKANQIYLINSGKTNDDQDASLNGNEITDGSGKLAVGMSVKWQRDYTNVDVSGDHAGFVGMGQDTLLKGGNAFGYSTNGRDFNAVITPKGLIFRRPDAERMWRLLKPNEIADINSTVGDKVKKEVDSATAEVPAAVSAANSAVSAAESAVAASKVNSDAIKAMASAQVAADEALKSASAAAMNAISDANKHVSDVESAVSQAQASAASDSKQLHDGIASAVASAKAAADDLKVQVGTNSAAIVKNSDAIALQSKSTSGAINELKVAQGSTQAIAKDAQSNAIVATQTASAANQTALDAKGEATTATQTASEASVKADNAQSQATQAALTASGASVEATNAHSEAVQATVTASGAAVTATNANSQVLQLSAAANKISERLSSVETATSAGASAKDLADLKQQVTTNTEEISATSKALSGKVDQTTVDNQNKTIENLTGQINVVAGQLDSKADKSQIDTLTKAYKDQSAQQQIMADQIKNAVTETAMKDYVDSKGYTTQSAVQSIVDQKADTISETITSLDKKVGDNADVTDKKIQEITASVDGVQSTVKNKADQSAVTQLANTYQIKLTGNLLASLGKKSQKYTVGNNTFFPFASIDVTKVTKGTVLTLSFDYSSDADCAFAPQLDGTPWVPWGDIKDNPISVKANVPGHYVKQITVGDDSWTKGTAKNIAIRIDNFGGTFTVSNLTLRSGDNVASTFDMLQYDMDLRVQKGDLLSQINLTAGNTLIQSNKLYLDASSVVFSGRAFIPSAAIASLSADKVNTGWLNTNNVSLGDGRTRIRADHDYMYIQPTGSAASNTGIRMGYSGLDFLTNVIPNGYNSSVPYYSIGYDGAANGYFKISAFDHINPGGATATQNWFSMVDAISLTNSEINFAAKGNMHMQVFNGGVNIKPTLFLQNNTNNGTWAGFTRADNSNIVEFSTGDNNGENFRIDCGARFMQYVYINGNARAQSWLTNSTLSKKTNIRKLDQQIALDKIRQDDQYLYEYKRNIEQGIYDPQASFIIDDVNDVSHYSVPREFIDQSGNYREPNVELAYLIAAFQAIDKQVQKQKEEIKELKEKLQHE